MQIEFRTKQLEGWYKDSKTAQRALGFSLAQKYVLRINTIKQAEDFDELKEIRSLRVHALKGHRSGQFAMNLDGFHRLIVTDRGEIVRIEEVSKHYGD